jgi:hypothetical protein
MKRTDAFGLNSPFTLWGPVRICGLRAAPFSRSDSATQWEPILIRLPTCFHFNECRRRRQLGSVHFASFAENRPQSARHRFDSSHRTPGKDPKPHCLRRLAWVDRIRAETWRDPAHIGSLLPRTDASSRAARGANPGVGPFQCNCSTESNRGMSVRSVANSRNKKARSRS